MSSALLLNATVMLLCLYTPKVYAVYRGGAAAAASNVSSSSALMIGAGGGASGVAGGVACPLQPTNSLLHTAESTAC